MAESGDGVFVGMLLADLPAGWWLPPGFSTSATARSANGKSGPRLAVNATNPFGQRETVYYDVLRTVPEAERQSLGDYIQEQLGPLPSLGLNLGPTINRALALDQQTTVGLINRTILAPVQAGVILMQLASRGISASIAGGTEIMHRAGWMSEEDAQGWARELNVLSLAVGVEAGRSPAGFYDAAVTTQHRAAFTSGVLASGVNGVRMLRTDIRAGVGHTSLVLDVVTAKKALLRTDEKLAIDLLVAQFQAGRRFDMQNSSRYRFNQIYVEKSGASGYWVLDSYAPEDISLGQGPVSRKFVQLSDVQSLTAINYLQEAYRKYRSGRTVATVPSRPASMTDSVLLGKLWLEVPVQLKPVPRNIIDAANKLNIKIRDVQGRIYQ